jgi:hypothetical protein
MVDLQNQILQDEAVREVMSWQQPDGWLAWNFHGTKSIEGGIRLLCEKGVDRNHPVLANALKALEAKTDRLDRGIGKVGKILDDMGFGGSLMIRAAVFAYARIENKPFVKEQINLALEGFKAVLAIESIDDMVEQYRGKLVFRPYAQWPSIYHLRLLAFTQGWRTPENHKVVAESIKRLVELSPIPDANVRYKSQLIAPASFCMYDFNPDIASMGDAHWMMWFHLMELLARLGVVSLVAELQSQVETLREMVDANGGKFTKKLTHYFFKKWGAYTGLMLEKDWRSPKRRIFDLTFRSLLILHFTESKAV